VTTVACPTCGEPTSFGADNRWRPFCSERCRLIDLGAWASEAYRIPAKPDENEDEDPAPGPGPGRPETLN
jgi:endogenous inhibitor of DNA gyrase (YacG/DUF329 family)